MEDKNKDFMPPEDVFLMDEPPLQAEFEDTTPELTLAPQVDEEASPEMLSEETAVLPEVEDFLLPVSPEEPEHDLIAPQFAEEEITADEHAMSAYDLTHPADAESDFEEADALDEAFRETDEDDGIFQSVINAASKGGNSSESGDKTHTAGKGRPKRKKGYGFFGIPHLLATFVWLAIIVAIGTSLGRMIWVCAADVLAFGRESKKVSVTITSNDTIEDIADKLYEAGLVRYPGLFELYAGLAVDEGDIIPGTFEMDTLYDYHALVVQMGPRSSNRSVVTDVLIPEGYNCRQIFELLEEKGICTVAELEEYAANGEFEDYWFLEGIERGDKYCLEGFLFPDTYDFYANSTPREALGKLLSGFEYRFTEEIYNQLPALNERISAMMRAKGCSEEHIAANQLDLRGLLTVASLIEEETASVQESPTIASVIFNRLTEDQVYERYLNIDAAIIYATGDANNIDTSIDSPYNTYLNAGLTPGPISNPGLDSINAVLNFEDTQYYYYVLNPETGTHQFSKTLEEHEQWVEAFRDSDGGAEE